MLVLVLVGVGGGGVRGPVFNFLDWTNTSHLKITKEEGNALPTNG